MIQLTEFERKIQEILSIGDKEARKMDRVLSDLTQSVGMEKLEILEFLCYGAVEELKELELNYDWVRFQKKILKKLKPSEKF
jgi:hypothetical protein